VSPIRSILELQASLHETGRIRLGEQVLIESGPNKGKRRPSKLMRFRFTSTLRRALDSVAELYGGEVKQWTDTAPVEGQWELYTEATEIDVVVFVSDMAFSQCYELWSAGGCKRRCDGEHNELDEAGRCFCDPEKRDCKLTSRVQFMLAHIPGIGMWRLETHSFYSASGLLASFDMARRIAQAVGRSVLPGKLRLVPDSKTRPTPTKAEPEKVTTFKFMKVVLDFDARMDTLALGGSPIAAPALAAGEPAPSSGVALPAASNVTPVPTVPASSSLADQIAAVEAPAPRPRRSNSPPPVPRTGLRPRSAREAQDAAGEDGARHGAEGEPRTGPVAAPSETAASSPDRVALARARVDTHNRLLDALDAAGVAAFEQTILEEFGPAGELGLEDYERINAWLDTNLPSASFEGSSGPPRAEGHGAPSRPVRSAQPSDGSEEQTPSTGQAPGKSGRSGKRAPTQVKGEGQPPPAEDAVPDFCRDLHARAGALGIHLEDFRAMVSDATGGRTETTKELTAREAVAVNKRLNEIEREKTG